MTEPNQRQFRLRKKAENLERREVWVSQKLPQDTLEKAINRLNKKFE